MTGYYVIYNHATNSWWMNGGFWQMDRDFQNVNMPTKIELNDYWVKNLEDEYVKETKLTGTAYHNVVIDKETKINPWNIRKFNSIKEAEDFMLTSIFPTGGVDFYTIRKIYF